MRNVFQSALVLTGREKFLAEVHKWVDEYGGKICNQMRRLGTSCDWTRQAYTMNEQLSRAVKEAFLRMHKDGLIYRDVRLVNWDSTLRTAVSDSEVAKSPALSVFPDLGNPSVDYHDCTPTLDSVAVGVAMQDH